jgi:adenosylhomocysteine nucleosidase
MVGIIVALKDELKNFNDSVEDIKTYTVDGFKCYVFTLLQKPLVLIYSGVGKANAAVATHILINHFKVSLIINVGFCGSFNDKNNIGEFIIPRLLSYCDVDATAFKYEMNQIPHEEKEFEVENDLVNNLQK